MNPFKTNFWPRPRDGATSMLLTSVTENTAAAVITAMAVWDGYLYYAVARPQGLPRLFRWDGDNAPIEIVLPAFSGNPTVLEINCMLVYNDELWIATSPNASHAVLANRIEVWSFDGNIWTDATGLAGWTGYASPAIGAGGYGAGWFFILDGNLFVAQDDVGDAAIDVQYWNGTTWTDETAVLGAVVGNTSTTPTSRMHAPILDDGTTATVYVGAYDDSGGTQVSQVFSRTAAGVWALAFTFPTALAGADVVPPVRALAEANGAVYAMQGWRSNISNNAPTISDDEFKLARVTGTQYVRTISSGYLAARTVSSTRANASGQGTDVILLAGPGGMDVFDPHNFSVEKVTDSEDDSPYDIIPYKDAFHASQGSDRLRTSSLPNLHSVRIARVD